MKSLPRLLIISLLGATLLVVLLPGTAPAPPPPVLPGKDSQVYRPETPGYLIKKNRDQVEEFMQVAPPPPESEEQGQKPDDKSKDKEGNQK